jgi:methyl-accepting chemotaxis protein
VEESTAAAHSLEEQSGELNRLMGFFQVGNQAAKTAVVAASRSTKAAPPVKRQAAKPAAHSHLAKLHQKEAQQENSDNDYAEF